MEAEPVLNPISTHLVDPPQPLPADAALTTLIRAALEAEGRLADADSAVSVTGGSVTLSGRVGLEFQRQLADAIAGRVSGVLVVQNHLDVRETARG
jgi:osmotically-inducible protein OsmY